MIFTLVLLLFVAVAFVMNRIRADIVALCAVIALLLSGILSPAEALSGFSNPIIIMMAGLFIVGGGVFQTGLAKMVGSRLMGMAGKSETRLFYSGHACNSLDRSICQQYWYCSAHVTYCGINGRRRQT